MSTSVSTQRLGITELGTGFNIDFNDAWHYAIQFQHRLQRRLALRHPGDEPFRKVRSGL